MTRRGELRGARGLGHSRCVTAAGPPYDSLAWALPFVGLLLTLAIAPLVAAPLWHRHFGKAVAIWALAYLLPSAWWRGTTATAQGLVAVAVHEYLPFVLLLGALFVIAGGLRVTGTPRGTPGVNTAILAIGTLLASVIGTTGAAMLMLRPLIRANRHRRHTIPVFVFFIILVANVGGALSPLGDPPLFLGFLAGVPFFWPLLHLGVPTLALTAALLAIFYVVDRRRYGREPTAPVVAEVEKLGVEGKINLWLLVGVIATVMLRGFWRPQIGVRLLGIEWGASDIVTGLLLLTLSGLSALMTPVATRRANDFAWRPIVEVAFAFAGIFITIVPVIGLIAAGPDGPLGPILRGLVVSGTPDNHAFFWATGLLSGFLDNAPTYLVFFGFAGNDASTLSSALTPTLAAISMGAVYFGALSYLGNAPNFMIKALAESHGVRMPNFFAYTAIASVILLPLLALVDVIFLG